MIVAVDTTTGAVELREPAAFGAFHVEAGGAPADAVLSALGGDGAPAGDPGHVLVAVEAVRRWAGPAADEAWEEGFARMLAYASSKGWTTDDGSMIRAHLG